MAIYGGSVWILWLVRIVVVLGALLSAAIGVLGFLAPNSLLALLGHPGEQVTAGTRQLAAYVGARELAIAVLLVILLFMRSTRVLSAVMALFAASNALDAIDALAFQRWAQVPGAALFAVAFAVGALWLVRQPASRNVR